MATFEQALIRATEIAKSDQWCARIDIKGDEYAAAYADLMSGKPAYAVFPDGSYVEWDSMNQSEMENRVNEIKNRTNG